MTKQEALPLRFFLGLAALAALLAQLVIIPWAGASYASTYPEVAYLASPTITALVIAVVGLEMTLVAAWQLVSAAVAGRALTNRSTRWANIMTASLLLMAVLSRGRFRLHRARRRRRRARDAIRTSCLPHPRSRRLRPKTLGEGLAGRR